jgi:hypothetical protein
MRVGVFDENEDGPVGVAREAAADAPRFAVTV